MLTSLPASRGFNNLPAPFNKQSYLPLQDQRSAFYVLLHRNQSRRSCSSYKRKFWKVRRPALITAIVKLSYHFKAGHSLRKLSNVPSFPSLHYGIPFSPSFSQKIKLPRSARSCVGNQSNLFIPYQASKAKTRAIIQRNHPSFSPVNKNILKVVYILFIDDDTLEARLLLQSCRQAGSNSP